MPNLMISKHCCPLSVCLLVLIRGMVFQQPGQTDVTSESPSLSPGDRAKAMDHWVAPEESGGKQSIGQNAISSLYRMLMALGMDGLILHRQRYTRDCAFHLCEYL